MSALRPATEKRTGRKMTLSADLSVFGANAVAGSDAPKRMDGRDVPPEGRPFGDKVLS